MLSLDQRAAAYERNVAALRGGLAVEEVRLLNTNFRAAFRDAEKILAPLADCAARLKSQLEALEAERVALTASGAVVSDVPDPLHWRIRQGGELVSLLDFAAPTAEETAPAAP